MKIYKSRSPEETKKIAGSFAAGLHPGDVVCLSGDLGAGKTAFVQGLAEGLGIEEYVNSPTFTIVNEYEAGIPLYHFDVYRIDDSDELYEIGYEEYIDGDGVTVIEWPQKIIDILPLQRYDIEILKEDADENSRLIRISEPGEKEEVR